MIADEQNPPPVHESGPEEASLLARSSAPTLRDLRSVARARIKTSGSSAMVKLRRLSLRPRRVGIIGSLAIVLLLWLIPIGCHQNVELIPGSTIEDGHKLIALELDNARFEVASQPVIQPAADYWLTPNDNVSVKWDTFELHWERVGKMCSFTTNNSTNDCRVCDYCNPPPELRGPPCFGIIQNTSSWKGVVAHEGFIPSPNPIVVLEYGSTGYRTGCPGNDPVFFKPVTSATYQFVKPGPSGAVMAETKIHVVGGGPTQTVAYQLSHKMLDCSTADCRMMDGVNYWTWEINGSPLWDENFSPDLRVTDIRILRGVCADGSSQGNKCVVPDNSDPVRPSRILFLPEFQNTVSGHDEKDSRLCYGGPDPPNDEIVGNFINLYVCRPTCGTPDPITRQCTATQTRRMDATPTYDPITTSTDPDRARRKQMWLVEFNTSEGADTVQPDTQLIIEFTIRLK
jgi:hypothetical protein